MAAATTTAPAATPKVIQDGSWSTGLLGIAEDPVVALLGYCLPCVQYGMTAEKVHGPAGSMVNHCLKFYLYSCCCACGLVTGPTRTAVRNKYKLPVEPAFLASQGPNADCLVGTIPCLNCVALCQDAREVNNRNITAPIDARNFDWAPTPNTPTAAPVQEQTMSK